MAEPTYSWTLDEYVLRCEDRSEVRELLVEADDDCAVLADVLSTEGMHDVAVITADYLTVTEEEVAAAGLSPGVRSELLTVADALERRAREGEISAQVMVLVDRDFEPPAIESRFLLVTDGYSLEIYALNESTFDRLVGVVLGASGRGSRRGRAATSGSQLLARVMLPSCEISGVRRALAALDPPVAPFKKWERYLEIDGEGQIRLDSGTLVKRVLQRVGRSEYAERTMAASVEGAELALAAPELWIRGHDYVRILLKLLNSTWGERVADAKIRRLDEAALARVLLATIPTEVWRNSQLLPAVVKAFE